VFPAAQCDLSLTLDNKGFLNAITYIGMISSAFIWGFLCDTLGRKKLLSIGLFLDSVFVLLSASSQNVTILILSKFLGGFIINGPFAALTTYLSEFHCAKHRARIQMMLGIVFSAGNVILPLLAWAVLPIDLNFKSANNAVGKFFLLFYTKHSLFNIFICRIPLVELVFVHMCTSGFSKCDRVYFYARKSKIFDDYWKQRGSFGCFQKGLQI
jgi:MFS family permease